MTIFITNFGLLDHTIERLIEFSETQMLLVHCKRQSPDILNDVNIKLKSIQVPFKIIVPQRFPMVDILQTYKYIFQSKDIIFDDFSGKDILPILLSLNKPKTLILHDVSPHLGEHTTFSKIKKHFYPLFQKIIVCSQFSELQFRTKFPYLNKRVLMSDIPPYNYKRYGFALPKNNLPENYLLIFGRISPYKGIPNFFEHYNLNYPIVIAGQGIEIKHPNAIHLNRYIPVNELNTIIIHSKLIILPYLEATQSGVLSVMSSFEEIPVLIRNIPALRSQKLIHPHIHYYDDSDLNQQIKQSLL
jgi:glycosyltransferase involved in cell wall biosynthesis